jgi:hypothetical protein
MKKDGVDATPAVTPRIELTPRRGPPNADRTLEVSDSTKEVACCLAVAHEHWRLKLSPGS